MTTASPIPSEAIGCPPASRINRFFAHTATGPDGRPDPDQSHWQTLRDHLRNVARIARRFAEPLGLADDAELAGLLHDLGKYAERFQARLRNPTFTESIIGRLVPHMPLRF